NFSWKVRIGAERTWDRSCDSCTAGVFGTGGGITFDPKADGLLITTLLLTADASYSSEFRPSQVKVRLGPELNIRSIISPWLIAQINAQYLRLFFSEYEEAFRVSEEIRWSFQRIPAAVGASLAHLPRG